MRMAPLATTEEDVYCKNCGEILYRILRDDNGTATMKDPAVLPESDGIQKYFRCPTCRGRNLAMPIEDPPGSRYYEIVGFIRS